MTLSRPAFLTRELPRKVPPRILEPKLDAVGAVVGLFFTAVSLLPSLLPRVATVQGLASAVTFLIGYGVGASVRAVAHYLGIGELKGAWRLGVMGVLYAASATVLALATSQYVQWQNEIRRSFSMPEVSAWAWPTIVGVALAVALVLLIVARLIRLAFRKAGQFFQRFLPRRLSNALGATVLVIVSYLLVSGLLVQASFAAANALFSPRDLGDKPGIVATEDWRRSGGPGSLVAWDDLGRQGRAFVASGPTQDEINTFSGGGAKDPIRVYVGLRSAQTVQERADLLLDELRRTGAFDRKVLVLATTTGTGWLDDAGVDPVEYIWNGDTAIAGIQYSYLPSWLSLLADQDAVRLTTQTVFRTVYDYWATLPDSQRPQLYLYGLSLGSYGVESVLGNIDILNEPISGALMAGPPFVNPLHSDLEAARATGTPAWHPVVSDGRTVRFATKDGGLDLPTGQWGPTRIVYLQHGSDPVVFFSPSLAWQKPSWLSQGGRAPDVSPRMTWFPVITMWQTLLDLPAAQSAPDGYGHEYSVTENLDCWVEITRPEGWTPADSTALAALMVQRQEERATLLEQLGE